MLSSTLLFLSGQDTIVILIVALVLFGGKKLPELAKGLGQGIREFKDASEGVKRDIQDQINKETAKNETPAPPPVVNTTLVPDHSAPVDSAPTAHDQTALVPDHSAPATETLKTDHPRETPLP
jgi:sec-independent protein translocase protein TatA